MTVGELKRILRDESDSIPVWIDHDSFSKYSDIEDVSGNNEALILHIEEPVQWEEERCRCCGR